jgi:UTP--glucose-1-phosphate uridylyltransferase
VTLVPDPLMHGSGLFLFRIYRYRCVSIMTSRVRKAIIPAAGYGTRFLPLTKTIPKEIVPVMDKPIIHYIVEEALGSGIEEIVIVTNNTKDLLRSYLIDIPDFKSHLRFINQTGPYGSATPIKNARQFIGDEPFVVLLGDELFLSDVPRPAQLMEAFAQTQSPVLGVIQTDDEGTRRYGIVDPHNSNPEFVFRLFDFFEKPGPENAPSRLASIGAYILTPDIFEAIDRIGPATNGEYQLTDAFRILMEKRPFFGCRLKGDYYDVGTKLGWLEANIAMAMRQPEMRDVLQSHLRTNYH